MSTVEYRPPAAAFLALLARNTPIFEQSDIGGTTILIKDEDSGELLGTVEATVTGGKLTGLRFLDKSITSCVIATGLAVDANNFGEALREASTLEQRFKLLISLVDDATRITGSAGNDIIETGAGRDTVNAGAGNDDIAKWKGGNLKLDGGAGIDTLSFQARLGAPYPTPFRQDLDIDLRGRAGLNPYGGTLTVTKVENVVGTSEADRIVGNDSANRIGDGRFDQGADTINALGGDDVVLLSRRSAGARVGGGDGRDELRFDISAPGGTVLDLLAPGTNAGTFKGSAVSGFEIYTAITLSETASFVFRGSANGETVTGAAAVNGKDALFGRGGADTISGLSGKDFLDGGTGWDRLNGGTGIDVLRGGGGADRMQGGFGADNFDFNSAAEIGKTVGKRDAVLDFSHAQKDQLDLHGIDANSGVAGNQDFRFIFAAAFGGNAGELHYVRQDVAGTANDSTLVEGDIDGNGTADFRLELSGLVSLFRSDFIL